MSLTEEYFFMMNRLNKTQRKRGKGKNWIGCGEKGKDWIQDHLQSLHRIIRVKQEHKN